jgi:hypothetical protein
MSTLYNYIKWTSFDSAINPSYIMTSAHFEIFFISNIYHGIYKTYNNNSRAERKHIVTTSDLLEFVAGWTKYGPITMEEPELGFQIGWFLHVWGTWFSGVIWGSGLWSFKTGAWNFLIFSNILDVEANLLWSNLSSDGILVDSYSSGVLILVIWLVGTVLW